MDLFCSWAVKPNVPEQTLKYNRKLIELFIRCARIQQFMIYSIIFSSSVAAPFSSSSTLTGGVNITE